MKIFQESKNETSFLICCYNKLNYKKSKYLRTATKNCKLVRFLFCYRYKQKAFTPS